MALCFDHKFDVLFTIDKNLQFQQNLDKYPVRVVVLNSSTSKIEELLLFLPSLRAQLGQFEKHRAYLIDK